MNLDERLERARDDYRRLPVPEHEGPGLPGGGRGRRLGRGPVRAAVAAVLLLLVGAVGWAIARDDDPAGTRVSSTPSTSTTVVEPPPGDAEVALDPAGPYEDGQRITLTVDPDLGVDLWNGLPMCTTVAVDGADLEHCEALGSGDVVGADGRAVSVVVPRLGTSVDGVRDCAADGVDCRFVLTTADGQRLRSERLTFAGPPPSPPPTIEVNATGPGRFEVRPDGLVADPSWLDYRDRFPEDAAANGPFAVQVCAVGGPFEPTPDPFGEERDLWQVLAVPATEMCAYRADLSRAIDPDDLDAPLTVEVPRPFQSYGGWADCAVDRCFVVIRRNEVLYANEGESGWSDDEVASKLLPADATWPEAQRPSLTIDTPGPHRGGDEITVTIAGLAAGDERMIGVCRVAQPWGCGYPGAFTAYGNGTHRFVLSDLVTGCGPESCYLELDSEGEGLAPLATAPLDPP